MKRLIKKAILGLLSGCLLLGPCSTTWAVADDVDDILLIDGRHGKIYLADDADGYNYGMKYLYDVSFNYKLRIPIAKNPTLKEVVDSASQFPEEGKPILVDTEKFINSYLGETTAELWYPYITWNDDEMAPGLLNFWKRQGLTKVAYYDDPSVDDGITGNYFVYYPNDALESGKTYPLVVMLHGGGEPAFQIENFGFCQVAAREGLILVSMEEYSKFGPDLTDEEKTSNVRRIMDAVEAEYPIDLSRVYAVGESQGGAMTMMHACTMLERFAGIGIIDQPASLQFRFWSISDETIDVIKEKGLPMFFVGGTADKFGLYGMQNLEYFKENEGAWDMFIDGWNQLMSSRGIEGKDLTQDLRFELAANPQNAAEEFMGYPMDQAIDTDLTGTAPTWKCTIDGVDDLEVWIVENRPHMTCGYDAENIWTFLSQFSRDENGMIVKDK